MITITSWGEFVDQLDDGKLVQFAATIRGARSAAPIREALVPLLITGHEPLDPPAQSVPLDPPAPAE